MRTCSTTSCADARSRDGIALIIHVERDFVPIIHNARIGLASKMRNRDTAEDEEQ